MYAAEAAVELLIGHGGWLDRDDFVEGFVEIDPGVPMAWIDWQGAVAALAAGRLVCSHGERALVGAAASLAAGGPVDLRELVCVLDATNLAALARAVLHAGGHRDAGVALGGWR